MLTFAHSDDSFNSFRHDMLPSIVSGMQSSPRTEMLYGINPLGSGQAGPPKAGLRIGSMKVLCWGYTIAGIGGANSTGPSHKGAPAEFGDSCALYDLDTDIGERNNIAKSNPTQLAKVKSTRSTPTGILVRPRGTTAVGGFHGPLT